MPTEPLVSATTGTLLGVFATLFLGGVGVLVSKGQNTWLPDNHWLAPSLFVASGICGLLSIPAVRTLPLALIANLRFPYRLGSRLSYEGISASRGSWTFGAGMCVPTMVQVRNVQPEEEITANNVVAEIEYIHKRDRFTVSPVLWISSRNDPSGQNTIVEITNKLFLAANEAQSFILFLEHDRHYLVSSDLIHSLKDLQPGKWIANISVTAVNIYLPNTRFWGTIEVWKAPTNHKPSKKQSSTSRMPRTA
jgi:hypothetical protein